MKTESDRNYNPVQVAYDILLTEYQNTLMDPANYIISLGQLLEALIYLGEALDD